VQEGGGRRGRAEPEADGHRRERRGSADVHEHGAQPARGGHDPSRVDHVVQAVVVGDGAQHRG
jgi:hypothetical protein